MSTANKFNYAVKYALLGKPVLRVQRWQDERKLRAYSARTDSLLAPPLKATLRMKELMSRHYLAGNFANGVKKVAWVTSGAPVEVLTALDFYLVYPENHSALCGARHESVEYAEHAENAGYSRDICSYARVDIGGVLSKKSPVGSLPKPDLLLCCNNICQTVLYWWQVLAAEFDVPLVVVDAPFLYEDAQEHQVRYVQKQIEEIIPVAERVAGKSLSHARLREVMMLGKEASMLWLEVLKCAAAEPAPFSAFDAFTNMAPVVSLRGHPETVEFYRVLRAEVQQRVADGVGALKNERKRVLWDNLPLWYRIRWLSKFLAERGVVVVAADYTHAWGELALMMDMDRPLESAARVYLHPILNRSTGEKMNTMVQMVEEFSCDGIILHSDRSCKPWSLGQIDQRQQFASERGIPALLLEADHDDPRSFSEEQAVNRLEAFIEMLDN